MVLQRIGIPSMPSSREGGCFEERTGYDEPYFMFDPSLEEVKEAFCAFDDNFDGFIDAVKLRFAQNRAAKKACPSLEARKQMMKQGMGQIDFNDFAKLMESSFC
ncbi:putative calcium-binding protein CML46 [Cocos nucifera]|uniref:Putative calcium-binding protein CML46 n=1 Tax=Cocos nucifera TaxID=13894 RepID=A0A8K0I9G7_COCNU|nr:putative calcium-binding protein CML46 [Cocos nucifera]